ncbi:MAG TPA: hypothetical protein VGM05_18270 [Planctomycetaceae bacterium]|jgi:uncharacterized membrane protein
MSPVISALAIAFAAFCVWLAVRIVNRRERWAKGVAVGLIFCLPLIYVLSVGPAVAWTRTHCGREIVSVCYRPIFMIGAHHAESQRLLRDYFYFCGVSKRDFPLFMKSGGIAWISG